MVRYRGCRDRNCSQKPTNSVPYHSFTIVIQTLTHRADPSTCTLQLTRTRRSLYHARAAVNAPGKEEGRKGEEGNWCLGIDSPTRSIRLRSKQELVDDTSKHVPLEVRERGVCIDRLLGDGPCGAIFRHTRHHRLVSSEAPNIIIQGVYPIAFQR